MGYDDMKLKECLDQIEQIKKDWPDGYNFKTKSKFLGFSCGDTTISIDQMESSEWGAQFESHDKEFNEAVKGLSGELL